MEEILHFVILSPIGHFLFRIYQDIFLTYVRELVL